MGRWSLEDDKILYEGVKAMIPLETLCVTLKRGYQGVKARINHLNNPKHKAFMRYFGIEEGTRTYLLSTNVLEEFTARYLVEKKSQKNTFNRQGFGAF